jgi:hypothetical protein
MANRKLIKQQTNKIDNKQMCSTFGKLCLILYICYGLFYCSYFSDAEDCIILAGIPLLFKEKPENVLICGQDQKDYPMSIKIKQRMLSMDTDIFQVFVEETHIYECDNFFEAFCGLLACIYVMNLAYPKTWE